MSIQLDDVTKRYAGHPVVSHVSLTVAEGELFVLLGPSGSGKSTVLRMIAGLNTVDEGRLWLHGREVTNAPPQQREVGFVFQHYALFRHMTVAENVEFALRVRGQSAAVRRRRCDELLEMVGLAGLGRRRPHQLSGGQQQRVALARALAHQPQVLLLDEPFGALDARIRNELRRALRRIQQELQITTIFVTHDQEEAFELADRLGVMNFGRLLEVGAPTELYERPQTEFVASFLGTANLLIGEYAEGRVRVGPLRLALTTQPPHLTAGLGARRVQVLFRPEDVAVAPPEGVAEGMALGAGVVEQQTFTGSYERLRLRLPPLAGVLPGPPLLTFGENTLTLEATRPQDQARQFPLQVGQAVQLGVRRTHALAHPGMSLLLATDGSEAGRAAALFGGRLGQLAHARVTLLGYQRQAVELETHLQHIKEQLGSGLAALELRAWPEALPAALAHALELRALDLVVAGSDRAEHFLALAQAALASGEHHLLLCPPAARLPTRALICVTGGEPAKDDVLFAGRLLRHLGAHATLLSVVDGDAGASERQAQAERFLRDGVRTLELLGVPGEGVLRAGAVRETILGQWQQGGFDLIVVGAPLSEDGRPAALDGLMALLQPVLAAHPALIVRSRFARTPFTPLTEEGRIRIIEEKPT
jgi:sulfate transport system ATP-binding protein